MVTLYKRHEQALAFWWIFTIHNNLKNSCIFDHVLAPTWNDSLRRSKLLRRLLAFRGDRSVLLAREELLPLRPKADSPRRRRGISVFIRPTSSSNIRKLGLLELLVRSSLANSANVLSRKPRNKKIFWNIPKLGLLELLVSNSLATSANVRSRKPRNENFFFIFSWYDNAFLFLEKSVSYQKKGGHSHAHLSFFWYDNDSGH